MTEDQSAEEYAKDLPETGCFLNEREIMVINDNSVALIVCRGK